jgi:hypothetical protein
VGQYCFQVWKGKMPEPHQFGGAKEPIHYVAPASFIIEHVRIAQ